MLPLIAPLRALARRQTCRFSVAAVRASSSSATTPDLQAPELEDVQALSQYLMDMAEEQERTPTAVAEEVYNDGIVDAVPISFGKGKRYPILKGFKPGQFTQPQRFSRAEYEKTRHGTKRPLLGPDAATSKQLDIFYQLNLDPLKECQNSPLMSRFVTSMGKIKSRSETQLTWKNQRRIGKAIRRAKMMGIIPVLSRRQLLRDDLDRRN